MCGLLWSREACWNTLKHAFSFSPQGLATWSSSRSAMAGKLLPEWCQHWIGAHPRLPAWPPGIPWAMQAQRSPPAHPEQHLANLPLQQTQTSSVWVGRRASSICSWCRWSNWRLFAWWCDHRCWCHQAWSLGVAKQWIRVIMESHARLKDFTIKYSGRSSPARYIMAHQPSETVLHQGTRAADDQIQVCQAAVRIEQKPNGMNHCIGFTYQTRNHTSIHSVALDPVHLSNVHVQRCHKCATIVLVSGAESHFIGLKFKTSHNDRSLVCIVLDLELYRPYGVAHVAEELKSTKWSAGGSSVSSLSCVSSMLASKSQFCFHWARLSRTHLVELLIARLRVLPTSAQGGDLESSLHCEAADLSAHEAVATQHQHTTPIGLGGRGFLELQQGKAPSLNSK